MNEPERELFDAIGTQLVLAGLGGDPPRVGDEYAIEAIVGAGGFGLICRANQVALHRKVALKLYPLGRGDDVGVREALREARSLARLEHPGIVAVHAAGESELIAGRRLACAFVELQFVEGRTLRDWLAEGEREAGEVLRVLLEAGRALAHAHQSGVLHRDFKPENLMVDTSGRARVIDFGLALASERGGSELAEWSKDADALGTRATATGLVRGTPGYMAPEASQGLPQAASDQFAFAVVVREALTGVHPFTERGGARSANEHALRWPEGGPELFAELRPLIDRAMSPSPSDRWPSLADLCDALEQASAKPKRRRVWPWALAAGVLAAGSWLAIELAGVEPGRSEPIGEQLAQPTTPEPTAERDEAPPLAEAPPIPSPEPTSAGCPELDDWAGRWQLGGKVAWTEYVYQRDWWLAYELELTIGSGCSIDLLARKFRPLVEGEPRSEPVETEARVVAVRDPAGHWRLPLRLGFAGDTNTYGNEEHYELVLVLDRVDGAPRMHGGFRRVDSEGYLIRTGRLLGAREHVPDPRSIAAFEPTCHERCRLECAGARAEAACVERGCASVDDSGDVCGPPSVDFQTPLRARSARRSLQRGESLLEQSLTQGSRPSLLAQCSDNAGDLVGRWVIGATDREARSASVEVELLADGCELSGTMRAGEESTALTGEVTSAGTWVLTPTTPTPALAQPLILVGVGKDAPAFGIDLADPARSLRAHRRP